MFLSTMLRMTFEQHVSDERRNRIQDLIVVYYTTIYSSIVFVSATLDTPSGGGHGACGNRRKEGDSSLAIRRREFLFLLACE